MGMQMLLRLHENRRLRPQFGSHQEHLRCSCQAILVQSQLQARISIDYLHGYVLLQNPDLCKSMPAQPCPTFHSWFLLLLIHSLFFVICPIVLWRTHEKLCSTSTNPGTPSNWLFIST